MRTLLGNVLERTSEEMERTLVAVLDEFEQQLFRHAEQARSNSVQVRWLEAQRLVKRTRPDLVPRFLVALEAELACIRDTPGSRTSTGGFRLSHTELALVENLDLDEATVMTEIAGRTEVRNSLPLYLLGQRFGVLAGRPAFDAENLPVGPQALCRMLRQASDCLQLQTEHRLLMFRIFDRHLVPLYGPYVEAVNSMLSRNGVLPNLHYVPVRARPTGQGAALPRSARGDDGRPARRGNESADAGGAAGNDGGSPRQAGGGGDAPAGAEAAGAAARAAIGAANALRDAANDAFQQMRHLLAGRRQLLGKLGGGGARPDPGNSVTVSTAEVQYVLGNLQHSLKPTVMANGKPVARTVNHLKQDLLAQLRTALPGDKAPALAEEDGDAIDLVGMLFDHIMKDVRPSSPASSLLAKLQVPLLRVALQDKAFFTRPQHPARQMLNAIAETGAYWLGEDDADQQLVGKMNAVVDRTVRDFDGDLSLFSNLLEDLSSHLQTISRKAEVAEKRHVEAARGKEKLALARDRASEVVEGMLGRQELPRFTHTLLSQAWTDVMALTALRQGEDSAAWAHQLAVAERLIQVAQSPPGITLTTEQAQALRQEVLASLSQVGYHEEEAAAIAQRLVEPQTLADDDSAASRTEMTLRMKSRARLGEEMEPGQRAKIPLSTEEQARLEQIKHLPFGTWFEFTLNQQGDKVRRRLSWFSTVTGHMLFVNHRGQKVGEYTLESLARLMAQNQAKLVEEEKGTMIDRAWSTVMNALRTFAGQSPAGNPQ
ncbi:DUF1631 domain-containing protein [Arenimonas composti]|nr:DUF1631 domain-containing protein [Arenimonas composti]